MPGNIKGITIELDGNSTKLTKAIDGVKRESISLQSELKEVDKLLKFNPGNADLIAQKQQNLAKQIDATSQKLNVLKQAQQQVEAQFKAGTLPEEKYNAFQREVINTEMALKNYKVQLETVNTSQKELQSKTQQLETLFKATGTSIDHYADAIGVNLLQAIKSGTASSKQLDTAIEKIGKEALGTSIDVDKMKAALKSVDDGASIKAVKKDLSDVAKEAKNAGDEVNGFGDDLKGVIAGLAVGGGIAGVVNTALDTSSLKTKIDITFDVPEESKQSVYDAIKNIEAYGVDGEAALEGVRRQWALNKDASDATNAAIVKGAAVIASSYSGVDFTELIQETNEVAAGLKISNKDALALTNALLKAGFPPEQLDTISEYGLQMKQAGFSTKEIQAIFEKGIDTKTWNIDNLNDGVKNARIEMATFGQEVPKTMKDLLSKTDVSSKQFQQWGKDVASGGTKGSQAMSEMATWLDGIKDKSLKNALATQIFTTQWEDQGPNMISVLQGLGEAQNKTKQNQDQLNDAVSKMDEDPTVKLKQSMQDLIEKAQPLLSKIAEIVGKFAEWITNNSDLAAVIAQVAIAIGTIVGVFAALAPIVTTITSLWPLLATAFGAISAPIAIAIAAIVALVAAGVALWKNWDTVSAFLKTCWEGIKTAAQVIWDGIKLYFTTMLSVYKVLFTTVWNGIKTLLSSIWTGIKVVATTIWNGIKSYFTTVLNAYKTIFTTVWNGIKTVVTGVWTGLKTGATTIFNAIKTAISNVWNSVKSLTSSVWNGIKAVLTGVWNGLKASASSIFNGVKSLVSSVWNGIKSLTTSVWSGIKSTVVNVWNGIKSSTSSILNGIKATISNIFGSFKTVVSSAMGNVKSAIENGWNRAKSFLQGINLSSIGRNIIDGLVNGIKGAAGAVASAVQNIANGIPKAMKKLLGIHSPSRVMRDQVGYWISEGLAKGISANTKAEKAAKEKAQAIVKTYKNKLKELDTEYSSGMIDTKKYINSLNHLKSAYGSISGATVDIQSRISKANTKAAIAEQKRRQEEQRKLAQKFNNQMTNITNKYSAGILTDKQYIQKLNSMKKEYGKVTNAISKIDLKIANVKKQQTSEQFKDDKRDYANKSKLANTSMQEELNMLNTLSKHYKKNSDERIYFENLAKQKKQEITEAKKKIDEDYLEKVQSVNEKLAENEQKLTDEYKKAVDDRTKSLYSFAGLFDEVVLASDVSGEKLLENLRGQVTTFEEWQKNMAILASRGVDEGLIKELQEMGPKSAAEIAALNTLSDEQLVQYVSLWKEKSNLARNEAVSELEGMRLDTASQITKLREDAQVQLEEYRGEWETKMKGVIGSVKKMSKKMPVIGANAVQGLIDGINSKKTELQAVAAELAAIVAGTAQTELDIHSPSRVMKKLGNYTTEGFILGIQQAASKLSNAVNNMYGSLANSTQTMKSGSSTVNSNKNSYDYSKAQSNHFTIYTQESPERVMRRELDRMAFKL
ncbi:hypothetical protein [Rummeliibacillus stabekisii]|uniref:hypothetical protein n=1 Tax=Rummeliibacillus stabekisii TaxID=241244 RepID=UPI003712832A